MSHEQELMQRPEFADLSASYGPGKFDTRESEYLWELSLNGMDNECGDSGTVGYYARIGGPFEHPQLSGIVGAILQENSDGFVTSATYTKPETLDRAWVECETLTADCGEEV